MKVLVAYESKYGATEGIARRIGEVLARSNVAVDVLRARDIRDAHGYDAYVIGSGAYIGSWMNEATTFVKRNAAEIATKPVWLFSSGPIGTETVDKQGRDVREMSIPKTIGEITPLVHPLEHHVFWGALDRSNLGFMGKLIPALANVEGDFRDWQEIEAWSASIAAALREGAAVPA